MASNSIPARRLRITLVLGGANSVFPGTNSNTLVLADMRASASVKAVARLATEAEVRIWGMKTADMNALTVAWANPPIVLDHYVIVEASILGGRWTQIFKGTIIEAQPDYSSIPDVSFVVSAMTGYFQKINPAPPTSYTSAVPIATVAADFAAKMGFTLTDGGATGVLSNAYFWGTYYDQFAAACAAAKTDFYFLGDQIVITQSGKPRPELPAVKLTPDSGLIGYPQYERAGLIVRAIYDPALACAAPIEIVSAVPGATGRWFPYALQHQLDARMPGGQWLSNLQCLRVNL